MGIRNGKSEAVLARQKPTYGPRYVEGISQDSDKRHNCIKAFTVCLLIFFNMLASIQQCETRAPHHS